MKAISSMALGATAFCLSLMASSAHAETPQETFFKNLSALCGQKFEGKVVSTDSADSNFATQRLLMHVRDCSAEEIRVPFWVGNDRSRTWFITRTATGLRLKHDHRHEDGTTDVLHWYGGDTAGEGTAERQTFPVDQESIDLFNANDASVSTTNTWAIEVHPQRMFAYELRRPSRFFRVEFDLTKPVKD